MEPLWGGPRKGAPYPPPPKKKLHFAEPYVWLLVWTHNSLMDFGPSKYEYGGHRVTQAVGNGRGGRGVGRVGYRSAEEIFQMIQW